MTGPGDPRDPGDPADDAPGGGTVSAAEMFPDEPAPPAPAAGVPADAALREAAGVAPRPAAGRARPPEDARDELAGDDGPPRRRGRAGLVLAAVLLGGALIAALVLVGRASAGRYHLRCGKDRIVAERGRAFPPWGTVRLGGAEWTPVAIPPGAECQARETADRTDLEAWFLDALVEQASAKLLAGDPARLDDAQRELEQALLLTRAPERRDRRKEIERLLGDVEYGRGAARVRAAVETLEEAGRRFDAASERRPRHATDAAAWSQWVRELAAELRGGPAGEARARRGAPEPPPRRDVPTGVALPVEEPAPPPPEPAAPPALDAGVPRGGVLL